MERGNAVPGTVSSSAVWRPADFAADASEWMTTLHAAERDEIVTAARVAARAGLTAVTVRREDFPLPGLAAKLAGWVGELSAGRAFVLIRDTGVVRDSPAVRLYATN